MGYCADYKVSAAPSIENLDEVLEEVSGYEFYSGQVAGKWYDHENQLKVLSEKYHNTLFTLDGDGEDSGDIWRKYFKNGKMQYCPTKITFDDFDESKLV